MHTTLPVIILVWVWAVLSVYVECDNEMGRYPLLHLYSTLFDDTHTTCTRVPTPSQVRAILSRQSSILSVPSPPPSPPLHPASVPPLSPPIDMTTTQELIASHTRRGTLAVQVGCGTGSSVVHIWGAVLRNSTPPGMLICIDTWLPRPLDIYSSTSKELFQYYVQQAGLEDIVFPLQLPVLDASELLRVLRWQVDIMYINCNPNFPDFTSNPVVSSEEVTALFAILRPGGLFVVSGYQICPQLLNSLLHIPSSHILNYALKPVGSLHAAGTKATLLDDSTTTCRTPRDFYVHRACSALHDTGHIPVQEMSSLMFLEDAVDRNDLETVSKEINFIRHQFLSTAVDVTPTSLYELYLCLLSIYQHTDDVPIERTYHLGRNLAMEAASHAPEILPESTYWSLYLNNLLDVEMYFWSTFYDYHNYGHDPPVFQWSLYNKWAAAGAGLFNWLIRSKEYTEGSIWYNAHRMGHRFMYGKVSVTSYNGHEYRHERTYHLSQMLMLSKVTGRIPSYYSAVIDYGGGTGDMAALFTHLNFNGIYITYDLQHMLLMQRYFLRYSGYPAVLVSNESSTWRYNSEIVLVPSTLNVSDVEKYSMISDIVHSKSFVPETSLFMASYSLMESPLSHRKKILSVVENFGTIYIKGIRNFDGYDNVPYLKDLQKRLESRNYSTCLLVGPDDRCRKRLDLRTFIAVRRDSPGFVALNCDGKDILEYLYFD